VVVTVCITFTLLLFRLLLFDRLHLRCYVCCYYVCCCCVVVVYVTLFVHVTCVTLLFAFARFALRFVVALFVRLPFVTLFDLRYVVCCCVVAFGFVGLLRCIFITLLLFTLRLRCWLLLLLICLRCCCCYVVVPLLRCYVDFTLFVVVVVVIVVVVALLLRCCYIVVLFVAFCCVVVVTLLLLHLLLFVVVGCLFVLHTLLLYVALLLRCVVVYVDTRLRLFYR